MYSDQIRRFAMAHDINELLLRFDADFDIPLEHGLAIGILRMRDAFAGVGHGPAVRVGAYWCDIVRADVEYDLLDGLRLVEASRPDAERLRDSWLRGEIPAEDTFTRYVTARWFDGTGKIRYRLGSYARARMSFETAVEVAAESGLWWCLPDLRSNFLRAGFEELRQTTGTEILERHLDDLVNELVRARDETLEVGRAHRIGPAVAATTEKARTREFLRGYSSLLHNIAVALKEQGHRDDSWSASVEALEISRGLKDGYRAGQSLNHQAQIDADRASALYVELLEGEWQRGKRIARQNLARLRGGLRGATEIRALLDELNDDPAGGRGAGVDIDIHAYTVRLYDDIVSGAAGDIEPDRYRGLLDDVSNQRLEMARSVRRAVAMPAYKRAYASAIRPSYLERVAGLVDAGDLPDNTVEEAFGLTEESSARELLDMLSSSTLPQLGPPASGPAPARRARDETAVPEETRRRGTLRRTGTQDQDAEYRELTSREAEFEEQFLRQPLETAPYDPEIAHRVRMYAVNNPGTCVVRYFSYGRRKATSLGAFVFRGNNLNCVTGIPYEDVRDLAHGLSTERAPSKSESERIWKLLVEPVWEHVTEGGDPRHLVVIPADDVFAVPIHIASPRGEHGLPLAGRVPLSHSVSATAFVGRGRHLLKRQPVSPADELAAIVVADDLVTGEELLDTRWPEDRIVIAGDVPAGLRGRVRRHDADWAGLAAVSAVKPEFFVYAGHGRYNPTFGQLGPSLELRGSFLTQYDVALRLRLPRNKLTILGACLAGQAAQTGGGDVVGFLRSLIAAGAGAIGLPLWSVTDVAMVRTVRALLRSSRDALTATDAGFDVVAELHKHYREICQDRNLDFATKVECMPISLYL